MLANKSLFRRILRRVLAVLMLVLLASCSEPTHKETKPIAESFAWWVDDNGQATLAEVQARGEWQSFDGIENWGFGESPIWVRYTLRAALPGETGPWVVRINPPFLEDLTLFDPAAQLQLQSGLNVPQTRGAIHTLHFSFEIPALAQERQVYLRIQSLRARLIMTDVLAMREAVAENQSRSWLLGFLIAISFVLAVWASAQWVLSREPVIGAFALKQWTSTLWALSTLGFLRVLLGDNFSPSLFQWLDPFIRFWIAGVAMWFWLILLQEYSPRPAWTKACAAVIVVCMGLPFLQFAGFRMWMSVLSNSLVLVGLFVLFFTFLSSEKSAPSTPIPRWLLGAYLLPYCLLNGASIAVFLNLMPVSTLTLKANLSNLFLDGLVVFLLLQVRVRQMASHAQKMAQDNAQIAVRLDRAQHDMTLEKQRRQEQSQFLHMLMHELKTPLSIVSLALGTHSNREENLAHAGRAVQDMKAIIDRCILADQTSEASLLQHKQKIGLTSWLHQMTAALPQLISRLKLVTPSQLPEVETDEQLLRIVVGNLLSNAAQYSDPLTPVTLSLAAESHKHQPGVSLRISNTPGLAGWPDPNKVFTKYYRASGAQRESGSGLGLFLSRQLAQQLGGYLIYAPSQHEVEFVLWIPLRSA